MPEKTWPFPGNDAEKSRSQITIYLLKNVKVHRAFEGQPGAFHPTRMS